MKLEILVKIGSKCCYHMLLASVIESIGDNYW